jgi:carboxylesterase
VETSEHPIWPEAQPFDFDGGPVGCLLSHGFTGSPQGLRWLGETLAREGGIRVSGPLLSGHGTHPSDLARTGAADWVRDLEAAADALRRRCTRIFAAGLSMGGTLVLQLAGRRPELLAGVVSINGALSAGPDLAALALAPDAPEAVPGVGSDIKDPASRELAYPEIPVLALRQLLALLDSARELLPRVACPALVLQSLEDHVVAPENARRIFAGLATRDKRLVWLRDSYHVATLDFDRERIAEEILRFVREHP